MNNVHNFVQKIIEDIVKQYLRIFPFVAGYQSF